MSVDIAVLKDIHVSIGGKPILKGVDLTIHRGEILAIIGPNGAGKSTLLKVLSGVLSPQQGQVHLHNEAQCSPQSWAEMIAYLPQQFQPHWNYKVTDLIGIGRQRGTSMFSFGSRMASCKHSQLFNDEALIKMFDLGHIRNRIVQTLSGGERARVGLAWALVGGASLLAADEPTAALDPAHQLYTLDIFRQMKPWLSTVVVMHDINLAARFADRIAVISEGQIAACGATNEVLQSNVLDDVFKVSFRHLEHGPYRFLLPEAQNCDFAANLI